MSNFAQLITSFERTGNFPLEANYIFPTVEALKEFYSDEVQAATLHKGLLKIVERNENGKQALYWVTTKETKDELEFRELVSEGDINEIYDQLESLIAGLDREIDERKKADTALWGLNDPSDLDEDYNSINDLGNQLKRLEKALNDLNEESVSGDNSLKKQLKAIVGTEENDMAGYMQTLPYTSITEIAKALDRFVNGKVDPETGLPEETEEIDTLPELKDFLEGFTTKDTLKDLLVKLWRAIQGPVLPSLHFQTLRGIEDYIIEYRTANDYKQGTLLEEMNNLETGVGLNPDGTYSADSETNYLKGATSVMNALKILDQTLFKYASAKTPSVRNTDEAVFLSLTQELDSYVLAAALKLSTQAGNQIIKNTDGLYSSAKTYYEDGVLTFKVNGNIVSQHYLGLNAIVQSAHYDKDNEQLVFVFKLQSGDTQTVNVPVGALIREWEPYNKETSAVVLERYQSVAGTDQLSADVRLSPNQWNILEKVNGALYVKGTTDNIYHKGETLNNYLDSQAQEQNEVIQAIRNALDGLNRNLDELGNQLTQETTQRAEADKLLDQKIAGVAESTNQFTAKLAEEADTRAKNDLALSKRIDEEVLRASTEEARLQLEINSEKERAVGIEAQVTKRVDLIAESLANETARSTAKDIELASRIDNLQHDEYTVLKQSTPSVGCLATYVLTKNGVKTGVDIDIPEVPVEVNASLNKGIFSLIVNGSVVSQFDIGENVTITDNYYDASTQEFVVVYSLHNGVSNTIRTSVSTLISSIMNEVQKKLDEKAPIYSPILQGVPKVEVSPDPTDSSQRIPSTAWVTARLQEVTGVTWIDVD